MLSTRNRITAALIAICAAVIVLALATGCSPGEAEVTSRCDHGHRVYTAGDGDGLAVIPNDPTCSD